MEELLKNLRVELELKSVNSIHPRVREEYRQILRHFDLFIEDIRFAQKLEKILSSDNVQFVAVDGDSYRPISAVEAISRIENIDIKSMFNFRR